MAWRLALRVPAAPDPGDRRDRLQQAAAAAREAKLQKVAERKAQVSVIDSTAASTCAALFPASAQVLGISVPKRKDVSMHALTRLAVAPRLKGSGAAVERARELQNISVCLLGSVALKRQQQAFDKWCSGKDRLPVNVDSDPSELMRGLTGMWDEAGQRLRALKQDVFSNAPKVVQVMPFLAAIYEVLAQGDSERWRWQPWLSPPSFLSSTKWSAILDALERVMPFKMSSVQSILEFARGAFLTMLLLAFDFAASNVASYCRILGYFEKLFETSNVAIVVHGERCLVHQVHIVKSAALLLKNVASVLFSLSGILTSDRALSSMCASIRGHVASRMVVKVGDPPDHSPLLSAIKQILCIDDDTSLLNSGVRKCRNWWSDIEKMAKHCHFEAGTGKWIWYASPDPAKRRTQNEDRSEQVP